MQQDFIVCIPSHNELNIKILTYLKELKFDKNRIYIFTQCEKYYEYCKNNYYGSCNIIYKQGNNIADQRNNILDYFEEGDKILMIDSDVSAIAVSDGRKQQQQQQYITTLDSFNKLINFCFKMCHNYNSKLFGVSPIGRYVFMSNYIDKKQMIITQISGFINNDYRFNSYFAGKEDIEYSLRILQEGCNILRFNFIGAKTISVLRNKEHKWKNKEDMEYLNKMFLLLYKNLVVTHQKKSYTDEVNFIKKGILVSEL